jgi:hypothetical protein
MTLSQSARYKAYALALAHLKENESITKDVPAFAQAYDAAKATLDAIAAADNRRQQNRFAASAGKRQFREEFAGQAQAIAGALVSYATAKNDQRLKEAMNFTYSGLYHANDAELGARAANILTEARALAGELSTYGITEGVLTAYGTMVAQYLGAISEPRNVVAERKEAGQQIKDGLNQLKDQLKNQLDKLILQFKSGHPEFYNQYINKRKIINPAQRKTQVEGKVTDMATGAGLADVQVLVKDTVLETTTGADGSYDLYLPLLTGATIQYRKEGYTPASVQVELKRGQTTPQGVELKQL